MNKTIKQLEKIAYTLERVFDGARQLRARRELEQTIASWERVCKWCEREFFPSSPRQVNCINCQVKNLNALRKETRD